MQLTNFDIDAFLRDSWQRKPALIKNPWAQWQNPLPSEELAGLALEAEVESRLIEHKSGAWHVENGPLAEDRFLQLGSNPWTLLVQAVDHIVPDVAALIEPFRFIPNWRVDDVMVSYANDGGGVGPHYDQYDVFLIQGAGRRRWRIGQHCNEETALLPHEDLRLLAKFKPSEEWILEPGDMLYVPPGIAHEGAAVGDGCMTYSVGFRAPSIADLVDGFSEHILDGLSEDERYSDAGLARQDNPGEIAPAAIDRMHQMMIERMSNRDDFASWFVANNSAPKYPEIDWTPGQQITAEQIREYLAKKAPVHRNPASRFAFIRGDEGILLFVDGNEYLCRDAAAILAEQLCAESELILPADLVNSDPALTMLVALAGKGSISFE